MNGLNTQNHDQLITLANFKITNTTVNKKPEEFKLIQYTPLFFV